MTVYAELSELLGLAPDVGEAEDDYSRRLALKANKLTDKEWERLSSAAQTWVNATLEAHSAKQALPSLEGWVKSGESVSAASSPPEGGGEAATAQPQEGEDEMAGKTAKPVRAKKVNGSAGRGRPGKHSPEAKIKVIAQENPHRKGSKDFDKFKAIKDGMTLADAKAKGIESGYIRYGVERGVLEIRD